MSLFASSKSKSDGTASGEPMVWFSGMWLAIGLLMIITLLVVIVKNGLTLFWPSEVVQIELVEGSEASIQGTSTLAGEVRKRQDKRVLDAEGNVIPELQLFVGNRDAYGFGFRYVNQSDIANKTYPKDIIVAERIEYGDIIGYPVSMKLASGVITADAPDFRERFESLVGLSNDRRHEIEVIEKKKIGAINYEMQALKLSLRKAELGGGLTEELRTSVEQRTAELQTEYEVLAKQATDLRAAQKAETFVCRLPTGAEREVALGDLIHFYYPNQMGLFDRVGHFFAEIWNFLSEDPREANTEGGVFPAIFGTFVMTLLMSLVVVPFGVVAAIYLREYSKQGPLVRAVRIAVNNLAGVPSIVFGVFGLGFFVYLVGGSIDSLFYPERLPTPTFGTGGIIWASLTLALMTVPVVIVSTEEALAAVSRGAREASLASGASKWQTIQRIVLPASVPGIITGLVLSMARGAGEVAPLMLVGVVKLAPTLPLDGDAPFVHLERKFMHLGFHIYDLGFQSPDSEAAKPMVFATTLLLIALVVVLNAAAIILRERLRRKYASSAF
jgi:phosphate transport system permease protein